jgi:integrase
MRKQINRRAIDDMNEGETLFDVEVRGFCVRYRGGGHQFGLKYSVAGKQRWVVIGNHGDFTVEQARARAQKLRGLVADGQDPAAMRDIDKAKPTIGEAMADFLEGHADAKLRPKTATEYRRQSAQYIVPAIGRIRVDQLSHGDVDRLHRSLKDKPTTGNRVLATVSKLMSWCERHGYRPTGSNPAKAVERYEETPRERFLSDPELSRLGDVLAEMEAKGDSPFVIALVRLLIATGARLSEILTLRWEWVDLQRSMIVLPRSKTSKRHGAKQIHLSASAVNVLATLPRMEGNPYVIVGRREGAGLVNAEKPWRRIRALAGIDDCRLHDLRHSFASVLAAKGASLLVIGRLLGHSQASTTAKYAHLVGSTLNDAVNLAGRHIDAAMASSRPAVAALVQPLDSASARNEP